MTAATDGHLPTGDPRALSRLRKWGGERLILEMAALFRVEAPARLQAARHAATDGRCLDAERAFHSLKSSCGQLGAVRMQALCEQLETVARRENLDSILSQLPTLDAELASFTAWLDHTTMNLAELTHE